MESGPDPLDPDPIRKAEYAGLQARFSADYSLLEQLYTGGGRSVHS